MSIRDGGAAVVPALTDLLDTWPECRLNVDLKADSAVDPTIEAIWKLNARDRVLLASFSDRGSGGPGACAGPARPRRMGQREVGPAAAGVAARAGPGRLRAGVAAVQVPVRYAGVRVVDARFVRHAHRLGMQVHVWTIDDPAEMRELLDLGVDGIMTDRIEVLRDVLTERGRWPSGD
jgi:glycerophosphoryl diester phosphodiesterase